MLIRKLASIVVTRLVAERIINMKHSKDAKGNLRCCFCGTIIKGAHHNPWPACKEDRAVCCDYCNEDIVIPTRLNILRRGEDINEKD